MTRNNKPKAIFIENDGGGGARPFCGVCHVYHQIFNMKYRCPKCGTASDEEGMLNADRKILIAKDVSEPMISNKKAGKKKWDADLPQGGQWIKDEEFTHD